jgi:O-antigen/teichoic acid export membrane protein
VGVYAVGYKFAFMLNYLVVQPFMIMWQTRMYVIHQNPEHRSIFSQIFVLYSVLLIYAGLAMAVLSPELVRIMVGPQFGAGQDVIPIVTLAYVFYGVGYYLELGMLLRDRSSLVGAVGAGAVVLNLVLNYFLVLHFGMMGAAWATLISFLGIALASFWFSERVLPLSLGAGRVTATVLFAIAIYLVGRFWTLPSVGTTVTLKVFLLASFPLVLWKSGILSAAEKGTLLAAGRTVRECLSRWTTVVCGIR